MSDDTIPKRCIVCGQNKHELEESCGDRRMYFVDETRTSVRCREHCEAGNIRDDFPYEPAFRRADLDRAVAAEREACLLDIFSAIGPNDGGAIHIRNVRRIIRARGGKL